MRSHNICPKKANCVFFQNVQKTQKNSKNLKFYMAKYPISFLSKIPNLAIFWGFVEIWPQNPSLFDDQNFDFFEFFWIFSKTCFFEHFIFQKSYKCACENICVKKQMCVYNNFLKKNPLFSDYLRKWCQGGEFLFCRGFLFNNLWYLLWNVFSRLKIHSRRTWSQRRYEHIDLYHCAGQKQI